MHSQRFFTLLAALAIVSPSAFSASQPPKLRLAEVEDVAPTRYHADLTLDPGKPAFTGAIVIQVEIRKPVQTIWLNASKISVQSASVAAGGKNYLAKTLPGGDDFVGLDFDSLIPAGSGEIRITYTGAVRQGDSSGVFLTEDSGNHYILTQFEATDARDAYPCFDEPSYKVPWQLTLHIPAEDKAVSNTPVVSERTEGATTTYVFKETKPLPSYLIAFGVGPFEFVDAGKAGKNQFPVRIVTPKGRANEAKYAAEVTATILTRLEDYFGIPFPYEKSDQVAVPVTIGFGAMENAGMVTYGQTLLLAKPESDTISRQRSYASVASHELAHQWFGDLVTTEWWNDIWLNEAFATWMEQKLVAEWKPEWHTRVEDVGSKLMAEGDDSLITARKIRQPIEAKDDINNAFDSITYQKGAAVIGMFESWMGAEEFRKGVQRYLKQYAYKTSNAGDFLDSISGASGKNVTKSFSTFLNQAGVPLVSVALDCKQSPPALHLEQARFLPVGSKGSADQLWEIPVCVRYGAAGGGQSECTLMTQASMDWPLKKAAGCPAWVEANADAKGYYRVDYRGGLLSKLADGDAQARLGPAERVDLLGNTLAASSAGKIPAGDALGLAEAFHADPEREVVQRALDVELAPREDQVPAELMPNYRRFLRKNFDARARELGWIPKPAEPDDVRLLRPGMVAAIATYAGDEELAKTGRELAVKWLDNHDAVSSEMRSSVLRTAAYYGDKALFDRYLAEFLKTQDPQVKRDLINDMIAFRDPQAIEASMQAVLSRKVPIADGFLLLLAPGYDSPDTRKLPFEFLKAHFDEIMKDHPNIFGFDLGAFLPQVGQSFCDTESRNELQAFFGPVVDKYTGAPRRLAQVLEGVDLCIANKEAQQASVTAFLEKY
jgi:alanyl aminopeptidase